MNHVSLFAAAAPSADFPRALSSYAETAGGGLWQTLVSRVEAEPFNLVATGIFLLAIIHTFLAGKIRHYAHVIEARHAARPGAKATTRVDGDGDGSPDEVSFAGQVLHFFGEIEVVFGLWAVALAVAVASHL